MALPRILHIAPFNTAGVPMGFVKAERALGYDSRLVTFARTPFGFEEDICLDLPFMDGKGLLSARRWLSSASRNAAAFERTSEQRPCPLVWKPRGIFESLFTRARERLWRGRIQNLTEQLDLFGFDLYQFDGGLGFSRSGEFAQWLHEKGKKIVCCYLGSDLRSRGVMAGLDQVSDCNFTVEFDHLKLHPDIRYLFFPFDPDIYTPRSDDNSRLRLFHSATNRAYKGSDHIIETGRRLEAAFDIEFVFMENTSHRQLIEAKRESDIVIDQITNIGGVGYGVSTLEALAMGLVVCTRLTPEYEGFIPDHPFIHVTPETLYDKLAELIDDRDRRCQLSLEGRNWVEAHHDARKVVAGMHDLYRERGWFTEEA